MNLFHILCEFCRTHDQNPLSYLKLFLSGKHSDFQQMLPTPTAKFQQSQCHKLNLVFSKLHFFIVKAIFFGREHCFYTQLLCAGHFLLFLHFHTAFTHFTSSSLLRGPGEPHSTCMNSCFWDLFPILAHPFADQCYSFSLSCNPDLRAAV